MKLAKLSEFRATMYTSTSAPSIRTLRARIDAGKLPGGVIQSGHYYVDLDAYRAAVCDDARPAERVKKLTGLA